MRRKQLLAFLMAGTLAVSMVPCTAFAEEDTEIQMQSAEEPSENTASESVEESVEEIVEEPSDEPVEEPVETPEEIPAEPTETPAEEPAVTPTEEPGQNEEIPQNTEGDAQVAQETQATPTPTPEEVAVNGIMIGTQAYATLEEAIAAVPDSSDPSGEATKILISGDIELSASVTVPSGKNVVITAVGEVTSIERAVGFTGSMFTVSGGTLQLAIGTTEATESTPAVTGSLTVDGSTEEGSAVEGSIVEVTGGYFGLSDGVTLTNNITSQKGGAIRNTAGTVVLMGGSITANQAEEGGAVYSEGPVAVQGTVNVRSNIRTAGLEENNISLNGESAVISVTGALTGSSIGVSVVDAAAGRQVVTIPAPVEGMALADVLEQISYEGDDTFVIDEEGKLKSTEATPTPTPEAALKLKGISIDWTSYNSVKVECNSNKDGQYYVTWVKKGSKAPTFDAGKKDGDVVADYNIIAYVTDLPDEEVDIYVCVQDKDGNHKAMKFEPNYKKRPSAPVTPTPDHVPVVPKVTESVVQGLESPLKFYPNTFYDFKVIGAGTQNNNPGTGDVKWVPLYWSTAANPSDSQKHTSWKIGAANGIKDAATYNLYVFFQKYIYDGNTWQPTDTVESATYKFQSAEITITGTPTPTVYGQTGGDGTYDTGTGSDDTTAQDNSAEAADATTKSAVSTADESPVGSMTMLAFMSLLAGGYVLSRKRKKENE